MSPDGKKFLASVPAANDKIWIHDLQRKTRTRLTNTPGNDRLAVWSPDGTRVVYSNDRDGSYNLHLIPSDGSSPAKKIHTSDSSDRATSWSPDGRHVLFEKRKQDADTDVWVLIMSDPPKAIPYLNSANQEFRAMFSPDGKWVAYESASSDERNIFVRKWEGPENLSANPIRISRSDGHRPVWSKKGNTLFYRTGNDVMEVSIDLSQGIPLGEPKKVMELPEELFGSVMVLSPSADGEKFLAHRFNRLARQHQIRIIFDWVEQLKANSN